MMKDRLEVWCRTAEQARRLAAAGYQVRVVPFSRLRSSAVLAAVRGVNQEGKKMSGNLAWKIQNSPLVGEITIYSDLGPWGLTLTDFERELNTITADKLLLRVHSDGGQATIGLGIFSILKRWPGQVEALVSLAASAASVIPMAADRVTITPQGKFFLHEGYVTDVTGTAEELRQIADSAEALGNALAGCYVAKAGGTIEAWRRVMAKSTWYDAKEAVAAGLADVVGEDIKVEVPEDVRQLIRASVEKAVGEVREGVRTAAQSVLAARFRGQ